MHWAYVGHGRGDFEVNEKYGFVGEGSGSWRREVVTEYQGWRMKPSCKVCVVVGLCAALGVGLGLTVRGMPSAYNMLLDWRTSLRSALGIEASPPPPAEVARSSAQSCDVASQLDWSQAHRDYCCRLLPIAAIGCPPVQEPPVQAPPVQQPPTQEPPPQEPPAQEGMVFDCAVGAPQLWIAAKAKACCEREGKGCSDAPTAPTFAPPAPLAQTMDDLCDARELDSWDVVKRARCCQTHRVGCPATQAPVLSHDCSDNLRHWVTEWTPSKKAWCCQQKNIACPPLPHSLEPKG